MGEGCIQKCFSVRLSYKKNKKKKMNGDMNILYLKFVRGITLINAHV